MSHPSEHHGYAQLVAGLDGVFVADGAAGLDDGGYAVLGGHLHHVVKGEERVGGEA